MENIIHQHLIHDNISSGSLIQKCWFIFILDKSKGNIILIYQEKITNENKFL